MRSRDRRNRRERELRSREDTALYLEAKGLRQDGGEGRARKCRQAEFRHDAWHQGVEVSRPQSGEERSDGEGVREGRQEDVSAPACPGCQDPLPEGREPQDGRGPGQAERGHARPGVPAGQVRLGEQFLVGVRYPEPDGGARERRHLRVGGRTGCVLLRKNPTREAKYFNRNAFLAPTRLCKRDAGCGRSCFQEPQCVPVSGSVVCPRDVKLSFEVGGSVHVCRSARVLA